MARLRAAVLFPTPAFTRPNGQNGFGGQGNGSQRSRWAIMFDEFEFDFMIWESSLQFFDNGLFDFEVFSKISEYSRR